MKKRAIGLLMAGLIASPVAAEMSVATFLGKVQALKAKGILALGSADIGLLKSEMQTVTANYRKDLNAQKAAGQKPQSCPPQKAKLSSDDLIAHMQTLPNVQASKTNVKTAFYDMMKKRYPCP